MLTNGNEVEQITSYEKAYEIISDYLSELPYFIKKVTSLEEYIQKAITLGNMFVVKREEIIKGFIIFYSNNMETRVAYISLIAVFKMCRRQNVGTELLNICETMAKESGMKTIRLEVDKDNVGAQEFYNNLGFYSTDEKKEDSFYMEKSI